MSIGELSFTLFWILMGPLGLDTDSFCGLCGIEWPILVFGASRLLMRLLRSLLELVSPGSEVKVLGSTNNPDLSLPL